MGSFFISSLLDLIHLKWENHSIRSVGFGQKSFQQTKMHAHTLFNDINRKKRSCLLESKLCCYSLPWQAFESRRKHVYLYSPHNSVVLCVKRLHNKIISISLGAAYNPNSKFILSYHYFLNIELRHATLCGNLAQILRA